MRAFFLAIALIGTWNLGHADNQQSDLKLLRKKLIIAIGSSKTTDSLYNALNHLPNKTALTTAYMGALDALKAKHSWNPYSKIKYLDTSEKLMQQAVDADPHNIEILFMRFSIQHNVPGFLGFNKNLVSDREDMIAQLSRKNYGTADRELTISIIKFLIGSKRCTAAENEKLHKQLTAL
ncbi:MAG: hypothetical protein ABIN91_03385 [Mucilaginibacter sp.]|uniref:hypothetical protein n=1 Tax=Mucilaginibacter sp. TaxID=1882438 RepID=UPI0032663F95